VTHLPALSPWILLLIGAPLNCAAGLLSFWRKSVDAGGAAAGAALGTVVFVAAGPFGGILLAGFVLSSTVMTRFRAEEKEWLSSIQEKGGRRDALQVIANGGAGMAAAVLFRLTGEPSWALALAAAYASANADTWASEIGVLSALRPVSLLTFRPVPRGLSGGVTLLGLAASLSGALFVGVLFSLEGIISSKAGTGFVFRLGTVTAAGMLGSLVDSILGSTIQAQYGPGPRNAGRPAGDPRAAALITERRTTGGVRNVLVHGLPFVTNDVVNIASTTAAAVAGLGLGLLTGTSAGRG